MKKLLYMILLLSSSYAIPSFVITFQNKTQMNINLEMHLIDKSIVHKKITMAQSYQFVSFPDKYLDYVLFTSDEKDKNGNLYGSLEQKFKKPAANQFYSLDLKDVPAHKVAATKDTEEFEMPATQAFTCTLQVDENISNLDTSKNSQVENSSKSSVKQKASNSK